MNHRALRGEFWELDEQIHVGFHTLSHSVSLRSGRSVTM
jgi:hypothetical protein